MQKVVGFGVLAVCVLANSWFNRGSKIKNLVESLDKEKKNTKELNLKIDNLINNMNNMKQSFLKEQSRRDTIYKDKNLKMNREQERIICLEKELNKHMTILKALQEELPDYAEVVYQEIFKEKLTKMEEFFMSKKHPSKKASEFIKESKEYITEIEIDNRKLRLALSHFVDGVEGYNELVQEKRMAGLEKYNELSDTEKKEKKLLKYQEKQKSLLEIGFAFERYYGYLMEEKGYSVKYHGILNGTGDGGIDLIAYDKKTTKYIQCKYWSNRKVIRENTVSQLYGSALNIELQQGSTMEKFIKDIKSGKVQLVLATKTVLSEEAKAFAKRLNIIYEEGIELKDYPMVKLVEGENKVFYVPNDANYDKIIYESTTKKYGRCNTCKEAEDLGYRSEHKWMGWK